ncbi:MAG: glycolate oxidase subunit GlcE [Pseudomonadota bacterium]|nr:glycolate oxidase subunit GlcE [Pseudomonadota bacterium]MDP1906381.1 glycolate oxidase subunit GlcE [Pseudomonadota bacterium]MDP2351484.1 glycolate oxidase subunit GlcE [Pseudomonadota bacterium]
MTTESVLINRVRQAIADSTPLCIQGGASKSFYGRTCQGEPLDVSGHAGDIRYEPSELVLTARAGTKLSEIETLLAANNQMLPFEPPHYSPGATLGGMVAAGLSGPRRPWGGSVRDAVLGVKLLNGRGEVLRLGGQVMKNVAGYDLSRLMVGALGTLGVLLEVSVKVLPRPADERTLVFELDDDIAAARQIAWGRQPLPLSATLYEAGRLYVRLSGSAQGVQAARVAMGGEETASALWAEVREQTLPLFQTKQALWRVSLPAAAPAMPGENLTEWGGALRWIVSDEPAESIRQHAAALGGHATLFRGHDGMGEVFHPLPPAMLALHQRVKLALDPHSLFNPGRLYQGL